MYKVAIEAELMVGFVDIDIDIIHLEPGDIPFEKDSRLFLRLYLMVSI